MEKWISIPETVIPCVVISLGIAKSGADPGQDFLRDIKENIQ